MANGKGYRRNNYDKDPNTTNTSINNTTNTSINMTTTISTSNFINRTTNYDIIAADVSFQ